MDLSLLLIVKLYKNIFHWKGKMVCNVYFVCFFDIKSGFMTPGFRIQIQTAMGQCAKFGSLSTLSAGTGKIMFPGTKRIFKGTI